jgi:hypothetical protein
MYNIFNDYLEGCHTGAAVLNDHLFTRPRLGYVNASGLSAAATATSEAVL